MEKLLMHRHHSESALRSTRFLPTLCSQSHANAHGTSDA
jgi:hypothetical protein